MRYRDASHVDVGGFYARLPRQGAWFRQVGHLALAIEAILIASHHVQCMACMLLAMCLVWLLAWFQVVGTLWRTSLVASVLVAAVYLSCWMPLRATGLVLALMRVPRRDHRPLGHPHHPPGRDTLVLAWAVWLLPTEGLRWGGGLVCLGLWLFTVAFFRNPRRTAQGGPGCLIAPADGVVADISEVDEPDFLGMKAVRIGIFLSVFDVHVNRSPCDGTIAYARYTPGRFLDARHPDVSHANEANALGIDVAMPSHPGLRILVRQLSGLIARRIICTHGVGDALQRGELYGMIKFGSRTELWLPRAAPHTVLVRVGERVRCGETALVRLESAGP